MKKAYDEQLQEFFDARRQENSTSPGVMTDNDNINNMKSSGSFPFVRNLKANVAFDKVRAFFFYPSFLQFLYFM